MSPLDVSYVNFTNSFYVVGYHFFKLLYVKLPIYQAEFPKWQYLFYYNILNTIVNGFCHLTTWSRWSHALYLLYITNKWYNWSYQYYCSILLNIGFSNCIQGNMLRNYKCYKNISTLGVSVCKRTCLILTIVMFNTR